MTGRARRWSGLVLVPCLALLLPPGQAAARLSLEELWAGPSNHQVQISPSGELVASIRGRRDRDVVLIQPRAGGRAHVAFERRSRIRQLEWMGERHLLVHTGRSAAMGMRHLVSIRFENGVMASEAQTLRARGTFVNLLVDDEEEVLWAVSGETHSAVYRVPVQLLVPESEDLYPTFAAHPRVARMRGDADHWVADSAGAVRAAVTRAGGSQIWYRDSAEAKWRSLIRSEEKDEVLFPLAFAANGRDLVVASNRGRPTVALVELSSDGELGREIFAHPDADMIGVVGDYTRSEVIGAIYEREGLPSFHYFDSFAARYQRSLEQAFPGRAVSITGASRDQRVLVVRTEGPRDPGTFYVLDTETNRARLVGKAMPWLDRAELAPVEALRVAADDGTELDVFVTRPRPERTSGVRPPLVVLPHGGPVGVRDTRSFDPLVQYLADGGIAVLQVNYRGSGGRGETFLDAGKRQWAKGIEDDIEAALRAVVDRGWADPKRVCIAGGSYGGYSALISIAQRPELYRCAASINGPSDVPLQLFHFGFARSETRREQLTELIGDPREDYDELRAISPVYLAERMQVPVLLIHGSDDRRVDVEHFHRMRLTLQALGKPHEVLLIDGGGHSPTTREWKEIARRLRLFLRRHLVDG